MDGFIPNLLKYLILFANLIFFVSNHHLQYPHHCHHHHHHYHHHHHHIQYLTYTCIVTITNCLKIGGIVIFGISIWVAVDTPQFLDLFDKVFMKMLFLIIKMTMMTMAMMTMMMMAMMILSHQKLPSFAPVDRPTQ